MNVCVTSLVGSSGQIYKPSFEEIGITLFLLMAAMIAFKLVVENFRVFAQEDSFEEKGERLIAFQSKQQVLSND